LHGPYLVVENPARSIGVRWPRGHTIVVGLSIREGQRVDLPARREHPVPVEIFYQSHH